MIHKLKCIKCNSDFDLTNKNYNRRIRCNYPLDLCVKCIRCVANQKRWDNTSDEYKQLHSEKTKKGLANRSYEKKELHKQHLSEAYRKLSDDDRIKINNARAEGLRNKYATYSKERRSIQNIHARKVWHDLYITMSTEDRQSFIDNRNSSIKQYWKLLPEEDMRNWKQTHTDWWKNLPETEHERWSNNSRHHWSDLHIDEKDRISRDSSARTSDWWKKLQKHSRESISNKITNWWKDCTNYELYMTSYKRDINRIPSADEIIFANGFSSDRYILHSSKSLYDIDMNWNIWHLWDFRIYDKNGKLILLLDIDGFPHYRRYNGESDKKYLRRKELDYLRCTNAIDNKIPFYIIRMIPNNYTEFNSDDIKQFNDIIKNYTKIDFASLSESLENRYKDIYISERNKPCMH